MWFDDARHQEDSLTYHLLERRAYPTTVSLVIPMFNEQDVVEVLETEIGRFLAGLKCESDVVLVNDGSSDLTLPKVLEWAGRDPRVRVIHLSRNFGHQIAATAGLDFAWGDATVLLDADLQDPLPIIHDMIKKYCEGYDVVYGQREKRQGESILKRFSAWLFYRIMRSLVYKDLPVDSGDFRLLSRECLSGLKSMHETHRFLRGMVAWVGYPQCAVKYERLPRARGYSKYPMRKMLAFAATAATSFSTLPLKASLILGIVVGLFGVEEGLRAAIAAALGWYTVPGWTSLMVVNSIVGSALLISIGVLGQYVGKIYEQAKDRPLYLVARTFNASAQTIEAQLPVPTAKAASNTQ